VNGMGCGRRCAALVMNNVQSALFVTISCRWRGEESGRDNREGAEYGLQSDWRWEWEILRGDMWSSLPSATHYPQLDRDRTAQPRPRRSSMSKTCLPMPFRRANLSHMYCPRPHSAPWHFTPSHVRAFCLPCNPPPDASAHHDDAVLYAHDGFHPSTCSKAGYRYHRWAKHA
jgi:hypothetical protein